MENSSSNRFLQIRWAKVLISKSFFLFIRIINVKQRLVNAWIMIANLAKWTYKLIKFIEQI